MFCESARPAALAARQRVCDGGKGDGELVAGGGGNTLSCSGAAIDGWVGPDAGLGAADLGLATILRGLGLTILRGGGGGSAWSVATTGLGTKSGGGVLNKEPSPWWTAT
jgi:hypothetical protein